MGFLDFGSYRFTKTGYDEKKNECTVCHLNRVDGPHSVGEPGIHTFTPVVVHHDGRMGELPDEEAMFDELRLHYGIASIQKRLKVGGFFERKIIEGVYTFNTAWAIRNFQRTQTGLKVDGVAGTLTIKKLFAPLTGKKSALYGVPDGILCGMVVQESGWDVCATGAFNTAASGTDRGLIQFNDRFNPTVTDEMAFDAAFSLDEGAKRLAARFESFIEQSDDQDADFELAWDCAIAAHNSPADAAAWWSTGSPPDEQIANYVGRIRTNCS